ncbi:hypothetical protein POM88_006272 [Heracleum sosnowskyi]|uniref:non-specific serine/threonine protein kinase n=1 Tax=Heracleum sosnowskyi TaxID=360622 RepID=A0AAD8N4M0_9APIA|nr:hypothetical protein POM88_006272 [Heracleum sosnowskyi]
MEDYGFEYSEEEAEEQDVDIENQYYNSKAVKRLKGGKLDAEKEFENEIAWSLESQLHGPSQGSALTWNIRMKIVLDIARGLEYLHERCNPPVIHRNLKSSNVLLDSNFNAKIDFSSLLRSSKYKKQKVRLPAFGEVSVFSLVILALCFVYATFWAVTRKQSYSWIGQYVLVRLLLHFFPVLSVMTSFGNSVMISAAYIFHGNCKNVKNMSQVDQVELWQSSSNQNIVLKSLLHFRFILYAQCYNELSKFLAPRMYIGHGIIILEEVQFVHAAGLE